jgi:hypothetical protein
VPKGYYTDKRILEEYTQLCLKKGSTLTEREIRSLGSEFLANVIARKRNIKKIRKTVERRYPTQMTCSKTRYTIKRAAEEYKNYVCNSNGFLP